VELDRPSPLEERTEFRLRAAAVEVTLDDRAHSGVEEPRHHGVENGVRRTAQPARPLAATGAQRVEERLFDEIFGQERQRELARELLGQRRLSARRRTADDDEKRSPCSADGSSPSGSC